MSWRRSRCEHLGIGAVVARLVDRSGGGSCDVRAGGDDPTAVGRCCCSAKARQSGGLIIGVTFEVASTGYIVAGGAKASVVHEGGRVLVAHEFVKRVRASFNGRIRGSKLSSTTFALCSTKPRDVESRLPRLRRGEDVIRTEGANGKFVVVVGSSRAARGRMWSCGSGDEG